MVAMLAVIVEQFLHRDPDRRAAAPDADEVRRPETAIEHLHAEAEGVGEQVVRADEDFLVTHGRGLIRCRGARKACVPTRHRELRHGFQFLAAGAVAREDRHAGLDRLHEARRAHGGRFRRGNSPSATARSKRSVSRSSVTARAPRTRSRKSPCSSPPTFDSATMHPRGMSARQPVRAAAESISSARTASRAVGAAKYPPTQNVRWCRHSGAAPPRRAPLSSRRRHKGWARRSPSPPSGRLSTSPHSL